MNFDRDQVKVNRSFRNYNDCKNAVRRCYQKQRAHQSRSEACRLVKTYCTFERKSTFWELFDTLQHFVDVSDPDINLPNAHHLFQTAEAIRKAGHPEWYQCVGLIHDLGKILYTFGCDKDGTSVKEQWGIVGDTFITGCTIPSCVVYPEFNDENKDHVIWSRCQDEAKIFGSYGPEYKGRGLHHTVCSFGHDEYLYRLLLHNQVNLPPEAYYMIRYHSLYLWHTHDQYSHFENDTDKKMKHWVKDFNQYDLYTKTDSQNTDWNALRVYYSKIVEKFFPNIISY